MKSRRNHTPVALAALVTLALTALTFAYLSREAEARVEHSELEARANRVFAYDREHQNELPAHLVRSLSLTLAFHDDNGARSLLSSLEEHLKN